MSSQPTTSESDPQSNSQELAQLIDEGRENEYLGWIEQATLEDLVHDVSNLTDPQRVELFGRLEAEKAAEVLDLLPDTQIIALMETLDAPEAARILEEFPSDEQADLIQELEATDAEAILGNLTPDDADDVRRLAAYKEDEAGGLMITEFLSYPMASTIRDVLDDFAANAVLYADYNIQYIYVTDENEALKGVVPLRRLLLASPKASVESVMIRDPLSVSDHMPFDELTSMFRKYSFLGLPVTDEQKRLVGVVQKEDFNQALAEESEETYRQSQGIVGGEELRSMPLLLRSRRRLAWLSINILLNILAASVIALNQETLEAVIALAVFLPIISDMSGCSGNQAVAVSTRELTLGVSRPQDVLAVLWKELTVGLINGLTLGILIGIAAFIWKQNIYLSIVVGMALMLNTVVAVVIGGCVPLILKGLKFDPALASGPILTTVTDMCGFFFVLTFASMALRQLAGV